MLFMFVVLEGESILISRRHPLGLAYPPFSLFCCICLFPVSIPYYMYTSFFVRVVYYAHMRILPIFVFCYLLLFLSLLYLCTPLYMCNYIYIFFFVYTDFVGYLFCLNHVSVMPFNSFGLILPYSE